MYLPTDKLIRFDGHVLLAVILATILLTVLALPSRVALADAGEKASCMGLEASGISPSGSNDEFPGGVPELKAVILDAYPGVPYGAIISMFAKLHEGSHDACDETP